MPKPGSRKPLDDEDEDALFTKGGTPTAEENWMSDEDDDPMEDNTLEVDEEDAI